MYARVTMRRYGVVLIVVMIGSFVPSARAQWLQWGGPNQNFTAETSGLADAWPEDGPKRLWHRKLGTGYSSIVADDSLLYTMYRTGKKDRYEYTIALDAATGRTVWRKRNLAAIPPDTEDHGKEFTGPNATPLIVGGRLYTLGRNAALHCHRKTDGTILWKHELQKDFGAQIETCGYSCSPVAYGHTIIVPLGRAKEDQREGNSLIAFDLGTGAVVWRTQTFRIQHSSPILITVGGEDQFVLCTREGVIGVNPKDGALLWTYALTEEAFSGAFATPVWNGVDILHFSSRETGYGVKLTRQEGKTTVTELWSNRKAPLGMATPVLIGNMLVGPKGPTSMDTPLLAVDITTGKRHWLRRGFPSAVVVGDAKRVIILDHDGQLGLATATPRGLKTHAKCQITERESFTAPTLVGTTLYLRDEKHIMALDLG